MKITTLLFCLLITVGPIFAMELGLDLQNVNLSFRQGLGDASLETLEVDSKEVAVGATNYKFDIVQSSGNKLEFKNHNISLRIKFLERQLQLLQSIDEFILENANVKLGDDFTVSVLKAGSNSRNLQAGLAELWLQCPKINEDILDDCLKEGSLKIKSFTAPSAFTTSLKADLENTEIPIDENDQDQSFRTFINSINIQLKNHNAVASLYIKMLFNIRVSVFTKVFYDQKENRLHLKNFTVKKGIIPLTTFVINAIKKLNLSMVSITGNNINIDLNQTI